MLGKNCQDKSHHSSVPFAKILYFNATLCIAIIIIIINFDVGKEQIVEFHSLSDFVSFTPMSLLSPRIPSRMPPPVKLLFVLDLACFAVIAQTLSFLPFKKKFRDFHLSAINHAIYIFYI